MQCALILITDMAVTTEHFHTDSEHGVLGIGSNSPSPADVTAFIPGLLDIQKVCIVLRAMVRQEMP